MKCSRLIVLAVSFAASLVSSGKEGDVPTQQAIVAGEVENPGRFDPSNARTLRAVFEDVTKHLAMGAMNRIRVYRDGKIREYDVVRFGETHVQDGDLIEVPTKSIYEGQGEVQDRVMIVPCGDPDAVLTDLQKLEPDGYRLLENWRNGVGGIEFRPNSKESAKGGVWLFVTKSDGRELIAAVRAARMAAGLPEGSGAIAVISRNWQRGLGQPGASNFEIGLEKFIRAACTPKTNEPTGADKASGLPAPKSEEIEKPKSGS